VKQDVSFLHIADVHLNSKYLGLGEEKRSIRLLETQLTLKKVICENDDAKIILFAGDIFDGEYDISTIIFLCKLFSDNPDKHFFISCGNHDYLTGKCIKTLKDQLPLNAHIFSDTISFVELEDYAVRIYGCSFLKPHCYTSLFADFKTENKNLVNIMLMHGDVDNSSEYNPLDISKLASSNLDYLALGHKHSYSGIKSAGKTIYAYPGVLEPRGFDECGKCGIIKGRITNGVVTAEFLPCSTREYEIIEIDITGLSTDIEIIEKINSELNQNNLYRVILTGHRTIKTANLSLYEKMAESFYCEVEDKTTISVSILDFAGENNLIGKTASILEDYITEGNFEKEVLHEVIDTLTELLCTGGN